MYSPTQWRNRRGGAGAGGQSASQRPLTGKFLLIYREKRGKGKKENGAEMKENRRREGGKLNMEGGKLQNEERTFFFSFHFSKPLKFILDLPKREFSTEKKKISLQEKYRENDLDPLRKIFLLRLAPTARSVVLRSMIRTISELTLTAHNWKIDKEYS